MRQKRIISTLLRYAAALVMTTVAALTIKAQTKSSTPAEMTGGFPIANFAISAQCPADGSLFGHVWCNTGQLGGWLKDMGALHLSLRSGGEERPLEALLRSAHTAFPIVRNDYRDRHTKADLQMETFCPIVGNQAEETALPVIMLQMKVCAHADADMALLVEPDDTQLLELYAEGEAQWEESRRFVVPIRLKKGEEKTVRLCVVHYDETWVSANRFANSRDVASYAMPRYETLLQQTQAFADAMPWCDKRVDPYLQHYLLPALILTRMTRQGEVLTMGYCELNQRDSFWTSWMHLVCFRQAEWQMIRESYAAMRPSGKIPTCIMPEIERWDDIDINLFLLLRTTRYYALYRNAEEVKTLWPQMCRCIDWVTTRDFDHVGMPQQVSFWCDWKDVSYVQDRRYSAFVQMLYLAALDQMTKLASELGDNERSKHYAALYEQTFRQVNKSTTEGGLWNGRYYDQIWKDGSARSLLCQDQMVGVLYDVVPRERAESIIQTLNKEALTPYGVCNMVPFIPNDRDPDGTYHNGGMWPWLSFMDCWARIRAGHREEALDIMQRIFKADITDSGDFVPNEHINTLTGENLGFPVQGWNACLYGLMYFALKYPQLPFKL